MPTCKRPRNISTARRSICDVTCSLHLSSLHATVPPPFPSSIPWTAASALLWHSGREASLTADNIDFLSAHSSLPTGSCDLSRHARCWCRQCGPGANKVTPPQVHRGTWPHTSGFVVLVAIFMCKSLICRMHLLKASSDHLVIRYFL